MHQRHNRKVNIDKEKLINTIKTNKETHIKEYKEAVEAYRIEANKQLLKAKEYLDAGRLDIRLNLTTPIDRSSEYDKLIEMFTWEVASVIEMTQDEFNDYVHDDNDMSRSAKFANSFYFSQQDQ